MLSHPIAHRNHAFLRMWTIVPYVDERSKATVAVKRRDTQQRPFVLENCQFATIFETTFNDICKSFYFYCIPFRRGSNKFELVAQYLDKHFSPSHCNSSIIVISKIYYFDKTNVTVLHFNWVQAVSVCEVQSIRSISTIEFQLRSFIYVSIQPYRIKTLALNFHIWCSI